MMPEKANFIGNVHGGQILLLVDRVAYACAARYSGHYVVTLSVENAMFKQPIHVGELVTFYARINYVGNTSMEVGVKIVAENLRSGEKRHTNSCYVTMVAVDEDMKPTSVVPLTLEDERDTRRYEEAKLRRELLKEINMKHRKLKNKE
ncbi:MAG: acyl-CoA thioesterase [Gammaproteobacteria bacterium]|nr:acyl-CoA thioesterase [Gammaproteobacteria bacterium]MCH9743978.1 acyl-CoA thioesterase [Gammaproteobacteria bacterium]